MLLKYTHPEKLINEFGYQNSFVVFSFLWIFFISAAQAYQGLKKPALQPLSYLEE